MGKPGNGAGRVGVAVGMTTVDYWFDPLCPWSWTTSRWMVKVAEQVAVDVRWHPMSLSLLNATDNPPFSEFNKIGLGPIRVCAAVHAKQPEKLGELYTEIGNRFHHAGDWQEEGRFIDFMMLVDGYIANADTIRPKVVEALDAAGLDAGYIDAFDDASFDAALGDSHVSVPSGEQNQELIGVPTISVDGSAGLFGPVISEVPDEDSIVDMWEAFATLARNPNFFELKRSTSRPAPFTAGSRFA